MIATNIKYDTDGDEAVAKGLPEKMQLPQGLSPDDAADYISDQTGWLVESLEIKPNEDIRRIPESGPVNISVSIYNLASPADLADVCFALYGDAQSDKISAMQGAAYPCWAIFTDKKCLGPADVILKAAPDSPGKKSAPAKKTFYIIPSTKCYYDQITAESGSDALVKFADHMCSDMAAYFEAVPEKPAQYPHSYQYPDGKFELALAIILDTMAQDTSSTYFIKDVLNEIDFSEKTMQAVADLQRAYETLGRVNLHAKVAARNKFYKILKDITGFKFDKEK